MAKQPRSVGKKLQNLKDTKRASAKNSKIQKTTSDEWEGVDYTTRCLCDLTNNDELMIECERCKYVF